MGILNVTPDSFSDGGQHSAPEAACAHARLMAAQGAVIIDVGGESTRPGSDEVSVAEELARVLPVVTQLASEGLIVSIDTRHALVARACACAGAAIINDVSGFRDQAMVDVAANCEAGLVVMHMLGEPKGMQTDPHYEDVVKEVRDYLLGQAGMLEAAGIARERICIDPGPGFGKTFEHNLALLRATVAFASLGYPLMAAYSRKGFIGALTGVAEARARVAGSVAVAVYAAQRGARVLRVHDVAPTVEALRTLEILEYGGKSWHAY
jgi:dihydropteroate synthase